MRFSNNDNINNDITRSGYFNSLSLDSTNKVFDKNIYNKLLFNQPLNNNHFEKQTERFNTDMTFRTKEIIDSKDKSIESMNSEINRLKNSLSDVILKDKEIKLKNKIYLLNKDLQKKSGVDDKVKELEIELKFLKKIRLDEEYNKSSEIVSIRNELKKVKDENNFMRKTS